MDTEQKDLAGIQTQVGSNAEGIAPRSEYGERRLIIMTRIPEAGRVKTRLIPAIGAEEAAELHTRLLQRTLITAEEHSRTSHVNVEVRHAGDAGTPSLFADHTFVSIRRPQQGKDLGKRLSSAVADAIHERAQDIVVIGTDCPDLSPAVLDLAWQKLVQVDVVFGPAKDGGYYLIGLKRKCNGLFHDIDWGTEHVLAQSQQRCQQLGLSYALLPILSDVDLPEDLVTCRRIGASLEKCLPQINFGMLSVVIPTMNEAHNLKSAVAPLLNESNCEVIIVDGGSTDGTPELARELGCRVVQGTRGRGRQLNAGAALARGEFLLFLHADTRLPTGFRQELNETLASGAIAGAFRFEIDSPGWLYRCIEWGTNLRSRLLQLPYGDQGLFMRASDFFRLNGYRNWPLMEDFEFSRRLKSGGNVAITTSTAPTSAKRWKRFGVIRNTWANQICIMLYLCGFSPESIAAYYSRRS
ncbi:TIGR04283 family arsenosugar biosynthesis glycosyltransferase [Rubinisphaera italica]|uniref:PGL/p-HBAD biosynthesis glycosyltransferase n=1 Tax=Rubinisphaera italica TaxID=2527969 RepID=A0A5C5XN67_9PLAN|nr:TIGR04283 family arsenosugar biosynthesis glycosyltransferase [Rubinisphaera italica]TWT64029.1 PGL/p-HBAD biosynthesis glycosyltransferase [Rubinisphaera italica]